MSEHTVYSLAKTLQNTNGLEQDLTKMLSGFQDTIEKEYLLKIRSAADFEKNLAHAHPPREVTLLRAAAAFLDENGRQQIDRMTQGLLFLHTLQQIQRDVAEVSSGNLLEARSTDSSGEAEEAPPSLRSAQMAGLLLTLALAEQF